VTLLILTLAGALPAEAQKAGHNAETDHQSHTGHDSAPVLEEGQRWASDAPLREAMLKIREHVEANTAAFHEGTLSVAAARDLADGVELDVQFIIANCRLAPEPDAALHVLIGRIFTATGALRANPESMGGLPQLVAVLHDYGLTFDHPGWES